MKFPRVLVIGATGRIGGILRRCWPEGRILWQSRAEQAGTGWTVLDPLGDPQALAEAANARRQEATLRLQKG